MKINRKELERTKYMHVPAGHVFEHTTGARRNTYIKTEGGDIAGGIAVNVQNGQRQHFHDSTLVHHCPNAFLTLE